MQTWDEYAVMDSRWRQFAERGSGLSDADPTQAVIGLGMARILGLCEPLKLTNCPHLPQETPAATKETVIAHDLTDLVKNDFDTDKIAASANLPRLDLLAATANGAPNVVSIAVTRADFQGMKEADDSFVWMSMSVMERVNEIGTTRAMGVRRSGIRRQFVVEGWLLGTIGASVGVVMATLAALVPANRAARMPVVDALRHV